MKFLVLALCVCAAAAETFPGFGGFRNPAYAPVNAAKAVAYAPVAAAQVVAQAAAPVVAPVATPVAQAAAATYGAAKQVVNKAYNNEAEAGIVRFENDISPDNSYRYTFETQNGISAESVGTYKQVGEAGGVVAQGAYKYTAPDGTPVLVSYVADENGYQPQSDLLPVAPEIPPQIARALAYIASRTAQVEKKY
ncbi:unnamed protein product [Spodoptera exigua]|uniref:Cuticular protein RR-1 n=1 Tax=Spodoptera exigua TaxID=7107 RepID=A0A835GH64_SPOEX|nr:hypothetical protein HW555_007262 [Spodoptera exigua]KAH9627610.1 hypothetical protein HF086_010762 [Spodoptera exigua]CAH0699928.1 unnamed protein product [Spodoptera exigua]